MPFSLSSSSPTASSVDLNWTADNDYAFNVRVSIANETTSTTVLGSTVVSAGSSDFGVVTNSGLSANTTYTYVMSIRRASNYELLGTRTATGTTLNPPPAPPSVSLATALARSVTGVGMMIGRST